jgi:Family of unknown function (DUF5752)
MNPESGSNGNLLQARAGSRKKVADAPFQFCSASSLLRVTGIRANSLEELLEHMRECSDASIFNHTFQTLEHHHFLTEGFSNDFAQWVLTSCNAPVVAERLASRDIRQYPKIADLRADFVHIIEEQLVKTPEVGRRNALEPFYFCEAVTVASPTSWKATTLQEFCEAIRHVSIHAIHYHFVTARLREPFTWNDFSLWLDQSLGLKDLSDRIDNIDIYTNTLEGVREQILKEASAWLPA